MGTPKRRISGCCMNWCGVLWLEYIRSGMFVPLLYLCVFVIVCLHSCIDNYNIKNVNLYWLLHEVTLLSDHCLGPPERALPEIDRVFHENEDILSETRAHVRTFQDQGLVYCRALWSPLYTFNTVKLLHCSDEGCCCDWKKDREQRKFACILWKTFYPPILLVSETQALILLLFLTFLLSGKAVTFTSFFQRHNSYRKFVQYGLKTVCCHWKWWTTRSDCDLLYLWAFTFFEKFSKKKKVRKWFEHFVVQNFISANFTALLLLEWGAVQRGEEIVFKLETILLLPSKEQTSKGLFSWNIQSFWNKTTNFFNVSKNIAGIANAALYKCPGNPSLNVNQVCRVCYVCGISFQS